jgi:hypothetical protein
MTTATLKLCYALVSVGVAVFVVLVGGRGGDPTWLAAIYLATILLVSIVVVRMTLGAVGEWGSFARGCLIGIFFNIRVLFPSLFFI